MPRPRSSAKSWALRDAGSTAPDHGEGAGASDRPRRRGRPRDPRTRLAGSIPRGARAGACRHSTGRGELSGRRSARSATGDPGRARRREVSHKGRHDHCRYGRRGALFEALARHFVKAETYAVLTPPLAANVRERPARAKPSHRPRRAAASALLDADDGILWTAQSATVPIASHGDTGPANRAIDVQLLVALPAISGVQPEYAGTRPGAAASTSCPSLVCTATIRITSSRSVSAPTSQPRSLPAGSSCAPVRARPTSRMRTRLCANSQPPLTVARTPFAAEGGAPLLTATSGSRLTPIRGRMGHDDHSSFDGFHKTDARWRALVSRDLTADGTFVYGVASTGVYLSPSCPSRRPRPAGVTYFPGPAEAERAGYRACRRCRPQDAASPLVTKVERARRWVDGRPGATRR